MKDKNTIYWRLSVIGAVIVSALSFSPFIIPMNRFDPIVLGMPRALWGGILTAFLLVLLTYLGTRYYMADENEVGE